METESSEGKTCEVERPAWPFAGEGCQVEFKPQARPRAGVTALIVAMKPGNAGGAKGCRKVETR